jgi:hypothetical protein
MHPSASAFVTNSCFDMQEGEMIRGDAAGFFQLRPLWILRRISFTLREYLYIVKILKVGLRMTASAPTSRRSGQRNACDTALSKSCNGVKGISRWCRMSRCIERPLRGRAPSDVLVFLAGRSNQNKNDTDQKHGGHAARIKPRRRGTQQRDFRKFRQSFG